jgi:hypothetical protein
MRWSLTLLSLLVVLCQLPAAQPLGPERAVRTPALAVAQAGIDPKLPVARWISGKKTPAATFADAIAALDPNKNYTVYCLDCTEYVIVAEDDTSWKCPADNDPTMKNPDCDNCVVAGWVRTGRRYVTNERSGFARFATSPVGVGTFGAIGAGLGIAFIRGSGEDETPVVPFSITSGTYQGSLSLQSAAAPCTNFTNPAQFRLLVTPGTTDGPFTYQLTHVVVNVVFNGTGTLSRSPAGGFNFALNPAQTGTLTQSGSGSINAQGTQLTGTFPVASSAGTCTYGPGALQK